MGRIIVPSLTLLRGLNELIHTQGWAQGPEHRKHPKNANCSLKITILVLLISDPNSCMEEAPLNVCWISETQWTVSQDDRPQVWMTQLGTPGTVRHGAHPHFDLAKGHRCTCMEKSHQVVCVRLGHLTQPIACRVDPNFKSKPHGTWKISRKTIGRLGYASTNNLVGSGIIDGSRLAVSWWLSTWRVH